MKTTTRPFRLIAICSLGLLLAGCDNKADSTKTPAGPGRLFGVSFQTMNNPFFVDLNAGLQKTIEGHGDRLSTLNAQFNPNSAWSVIAVRSASDFVAQTGSRVHPRSCSGWNSSRCDE